MSEDFIAYRDGEKWGFRRVDGSAAIQARYDAVGSFSEGLARVRDRRLWGFIDTDGAVVIDVRFEQARHFSGGYAKVKWEGRWGLIDIAGNWVETVESQSYLDNRGRFVTEQDHQNWEKPPGQNTEREEE